ncbi:MAG: right-handed parallel beta-helix repeat-containing protein [bacterium]|nr:right-handed parallel beta-helix repeat-containing protein [bacterium]
MRRVALFALAAIVLQGASCQTGPFNQDPFDDTRNLSDALPVIPGAEGFGTDTPAGRGGDVIRVTNLNDEGPGSLRAALATPGPRTIVFEVAGVIDTNRVMAVHHPFATVAGQTAPSPGITIIGAGVVVVTHDVLIQHIRVRVGDRVDGPDPGGRDGMAVTGTPDGATDACNVVFDHCSVSWAVDEGCSTWYPGVRDVTFRQCIIAENLSRAIHPKGEHSKGLLIGDHSRRVSAIGNLMAHNMRRNPLIKGDVSALVVNNLIYNPGQVAIHFSDPEGMGPARATIIGNVLIKGPNTRLGVNVISTSFDTKPGTRIFGADNGVADRLDKGGAVTAKAKLINTTDPPVMVEPLTPLGSGEVVEWVLATAGARPADRDETDVRVVRSVRNGTGGIIDSQNEVGGFPGGPPVVRPLVLPDDPSGDADGDGYTNLEEWLHEFSAEVEGIAR